MTKSRRLADKLNEAKAVPKVSGGEVKVACADANPGEPPQWFTGYVDDHPAGADRGGYVPFVFHDGGAAFWHPAECFWQAG